MKSPALSQQHVQMLLKYSGITFISGAVNHGFFSVERSLLTALGGMVMFVLGAWMAHRQSQSEGQQESLWRTLFWGSLLSIGLGLFTGGLQHFPDSPARSAWVVPLGFVVSAVALMVEEGRARVSRAAVVYCVVVGLGVTAASIAAWQWYEANPHHIGDPMHGGAGGHTH